MRGIANSITTTSNWLFNFITSAIFLKITATDTGKIVAYSILAISCFLTYMFVRRYLPETKDKSIDICVRIVKEARTKGCSTAKKMNESLTIGEGGDLLTN